MNTWHTSRGYVPHLITWGRCVKWGGVRDRVRDSRPEGPPKPTRNRTESVTGASAFGGARRSQGFRNPLRHRDMSGCRPDIARRGLRVKRTPEVSHRGRSVRRRDAENRVNLRYAAGPLMFSRVMYAIRAACVTRQGVPAAVKGGHARGLNSRLTLEEPRRGLCKGAAIGRARRGAVSVGHGLTVPPYRVGGYPYGSLRVTTPRPCYRLPHRISTTLTRRRRCDLSRWISRRGLAVASWVFHLMALMGLARSVGVLALPRRP